MFQSGQPLNTENRIYYEHFDEVGRWLEVTDQDLNEVGVDLGVTLDCTYRNGRFVYLHSTEVTHFIIPFLKCYNHLPNICKIDNGHYSAIRSFMPIKNFYKLIDF